MNTNDVERNPGAGDAPPPALGDPWSFQRSLRRFDLPVACLSLLLWAAPVHADTSAYTDRSLNPRSIMRFTMDYSARIEAAKHQLKSAESNYQLFESEFTQFTPLRLKGVSFTHGHDGRKPGPRKRVPGYDPGLRLYLW